MTKTTAFWIGPKLISSWFLEMLNIFWTVELRNHCSCKMLSSSICKCLFPFVLPSLLDLLAVINLFFSNCSNCSLSNIELSHLLFYKHIKHFCMAGTTLNAVITHCNHLLLQQRSPGYQAGVQRCHHLN